MPQGSKSNKQNDQNIAHYMHFAITAPVFESLKIGRKNLRVLS